MAPERLREMLDRFGSVNVVGEAFTVYKLGPDLDVSIPRRERKSGRGHRAFVIEGDPAMSVEDATRRRDFTINAILQDPLTGELIDPFGGRQDIARRRAARGFGGDVCRRQFARVACSAVCSALRVSDRAGRRLSCAGRWISGSARRTHLGGVGKAVAAGATSVDRARLVAKTWACCKTCFPRSRRLIDVPQDPEWHPEGDVFVHTLLVVDRARELIDDLPYARQVTVMLARVGPRFWQAADDAVSRRALAFART